MPATDELYREVATDLWCSDKLQIDHDAAVSSSDLGAWVHAWVWVSNDKAGIGVGSTAVPRVE
jgi:uncharacterized protein involved in type VI secretion and phage assembly